MLKHAAWAVILVIFGLLSYGTYSSLHSDSIPTWEIGIIIALLWLVFIFITYLLYGNLEDYLP